MVFILIYCAIVLHRAAKFKIYIAICIYLKNKTGCKHRLFYFYKVVVQLPTMLYAAYSSGGSS